MFTQRTSLHGRKFGLSSTGGLITPPEKDSTGSTLPHTMAAQMWGEGMHAVHVMSTINSTLTNFGTSVLDSTGSTSSSAPTFEMGRPEQGVHKYVHIGASSSELTLGGTSTAIVFQSTNDGAGSTLFCSAVNLSGKVIHLIGASTARWILAGSTAAITIG